MLLDQPTPSRKRKADDSVPEAGELMKLKSTKRARKSSGPGNEDSIVFVLE